MIGQLTRFAGVGALATLVHVFAALGAAELLRLSPQGANAFGFLSAVSVSYFGHGRLTFDKALEHRFHAPRFLLTSCMALIISSGLVHVLTVTLGFALAVAMGAIAVAVPLASFVMYKFWVFADKPSAQGSV